MSADSPPLIVTVARTSGRLEHDWETQGEVSWSDRKQYTVIRVFKNGGALEGQAPIQTGHISKYIPLSEFLSLNPLWTTRAKQVCEIIRIPFP